MHKSQYMECKTNYVTMGRKSWTDEQKKLQSGLIKQWKPWEFSTGPRTPEGKKISSRNAYLELEKMNCPQLIRKYGRDLREYQHHKRLLLSKVKQLFTAEPDSGLPVPMNEVFDAL